MDSINKIALFFVCVFALTQGHHKPGIIEEIRSKFGSRIIDGSQAASGQFPWQALLLTNQDIGGHYICGGTLISPSWVLTAAHCLQGASTNVLLGHIAYPSSPVIILTSNFHTHPEYNPDNFNNDIALVGLSNPVTENANVRAVPCAKDSSVTFAGIDATISGFGSTSDSGPLSMYLNYATVEVISNAECAAYYGDSVVIPSTLCVVGSSSTSQGACQGDSGGPLVHDIDGVTTLIGVINFGSSSGCSSSSPNGLSRITHHASWINSITGL